MQRTFTYWLKEKIKEGLYIFLKKTKSKKNLNINHPERFFAGKNVQISKNVVLDSIGGIIIGDNSIILDDVEIASSWPDPVDAFFSFLCVPVVIGKSVIINKNVRIQPGSIILDGSFIDSGTTVKGITGSTRLKNTLGRKFKYYINNYLTNRVTAANLGKDIVFVVSTGRAGSTTIAKVLNEHQSIVGRHEFYKFLIWLSTLYEHNEISEENVFLILKTVFVNSSNYLKNQVYVESDHKFFNLIELLAKILPEARFVWLVRNAKNFIASSLPRGWYADSEKDFLRESKEYVKYRIRGDKCGDFTEKEWVNMSQFEKHCWYWTYVNCRIDDQLKRINENRWIIIKLEDLNSSNNILESFLGKSLESVAFKSLNKGSYQKFDNDLWEEDMEASFNLICKSTLRKLNYND